MSKGDGESPKKRGRGGRVKGYTPTAGQLAGLAKGRATRDKNLAEAKKNPNRLKRKDKIKMLLSGEMAVKDLSDDEIIRLDVCNSVGHFAGSNRVRGLPSTLIRQMEAERLRRFKDGIMVLQGKANRVFKNILDDDGEDSNTRLKAAQIVTERNLGKPESVVKVDLTESAWGKLDVELTRDAEADAAD